MGWKRRRRRGETSHKRWIIVGIFFGGLLTFLLTGAVAANAVHLEDILTGSPGVDRVDWNDSLYIEVDEATYLNRIYQERTHEIAYCGLIDADNPPRIEVWLADTVSAGPDTVEFITNNCPPNTGVLLHTHPSGSKRLSEKDERTLSNRPEDIMCVQGGNLQTTVGEVVDNLACYRELPVTDSETVNIRIPVVAAENELIVSE